MNKIDTLNLEDVKVSQKWEEQVKHAEPVNHNMDSNTRKTSFLKNIRRQDWTAKNIETFKWDKFTPNSCQVLGATMAQVVVHSNFAPSALFLFSTFPCCKRHRIKHILFQVCVFMIPKRINQQSQILEAFKIIILVKSFNNVLPQGNFIGPPITFIHETQLFLW